MLIFFDTEFTELAAGARLISIGCVTEDSGERTFYAELSDTYVPSDCGAFARQNVLPLLDSSASAKKWIEVAYDLRGWIESIQVPVDLTTDSILWDWPWIQKLFADPVGWPSNLARQPEGVPASYRIFEEAVEIAYSSGLRRHHALDDAKANRLGYEAVRAWWQPAE